MRKLPLLITAFLLAHFSFGQAQDVWVRFYDSTRAQSGYKDREGNIKIPAKFEGFTRADSFYHIIAVSEKVDSLYKSYYLLKDGRKVGQDSVYLFDFRVDCESEGKIIFYDRKKDRVGFLDKNGVAIIPAIYNFVLPFHNGLALAHRNAKRTCWDEGGDTTTCEHLGWEGGETILINDKNEVLADSVDIDLSSINWFSKKENASFIDTSIYVAIKGRKIRFSFVDYQKEFKNWFNNSFLPTLHTKNSTLKNWLFTEVTYWSPNKGWTSLDKRAFFRLFPNALTAERFQTGKLKELSISEETTNPFMTDSKWYNMYYDACGEHNRYRFPAFDVMLTYYKKRLKPIEEIEGFLKDYEIDYQENFIFLRTEEGYRLFQVSLKR